MSGGDNHSRLEVLLIDIIKTRNGEFTHGTTEHIGQHLLGTKWILVRHRQACGHHQHSFFGYDVNFFGGVQLLVHVEEGERRHNSYAFPYTRNYTA